jgi:hypothetical protein
MEAVDWREIGGANNSRRQWNGLDQTKLDLVNVDLQGHRCGCGTRPDLLITITASTSIASYSAIQSMWMLGNRAAVHVGGGSEGGVEVPGWDDRVQGTV